MSEPVWLRANAAPWPTARARALGRNLVLATGNLQDCELVKGPHCRPQTFRFITHRLHVRSALPQGNALQLSGCYFLFFVLESFFLDVTIY